MTRENTLSEKIFFMKDFRNKWAKQFRKPDDDFEEDCQMIMEDYGEEPSCPLSFEELDNIFNEAYKTEKAKYKKEKTNAKDNDSKVIERNLLDLRRAIEKLDINPALDTFSNSVYVYVGKNKIPGLDVGLHILDDDLVQAIRIDAIAQSFRFRGEEGFQAAQFPTKDVEDALRNMAVKTKFNLKDL